MYDYDQVKEILSIFKDARARLYTYNELKGHLFDIHDFDSLPEWSEYFHLRSDLKKIIFFIYHKDNIEE